MHGEDAVCSRIRHVDVPVQALCSCTDGTRARQDRAAATGRGVDSHIDLTVSSEREDLTARPVAEQQFAVGTSGEPTVAQTVRVRQREHRPRSQVQAPHARIGLPRPLAHVEAA